MKPLFNIRGEGSFAFIMGILSGYPMGAKIAANFRQMFMLCQKNIQLSYKNQTVNSRLPGSHFKILFWILPSYRSLHAHSGVAHSDLHQIVFSVLLLSTQLQTLCFISKYSS